MKNSFKPFAIPVLACLALLVGASPASSQSKLVKLSIDSKYAKRSMPFIVYLPAGYGNDQKYPVWYALHGLGGNESMWIDSVGADEAADSAFASGEAKPLIMVFPVTRNDSMKEVQDNRDKDGNFGEQYYDQFFCKELVPYIDAKFDTVGSPAGRSIGGFSLGGMIALRLAFHHPELFGRVGGFSAAVPATAFDERELEAWLYPNDEVDGIADIAAFDRAKGFEKARVYLDAGTQGDPFFEALKSLDECLRKKGMSSDFHPFEGGHDITHARQDIKAYFVFFTS